MLKWLWFCDIIVSCCNTGNW